MRRTQSPVVSACLQCSRADWLHHPWAWMLRANVPGCQSTKSYTIAWALNSLALSCFFLAKHLCSVAKCPAKRFCVAILAGLGIQNSNRFSPSCAVLHNEAEVLSKHPGSNMQRSKLPQANLQKIIRATNQNQGGRPCPCSTPRCTSLSLPKMPSVNSFVSLTLPANWLTAVGRFTHDISVGTLCMPSCFTTTAWPPLSDRFRDRPYVFQKSSK